MAALEGAAPVSAGAAMLRIGRRSPHSSRAALCALDKRNADDLFDVTMREAGARQRPWHQALITERAGLLHQAHGMKCTGEMLLAQARELYRAWGASAKVRQLEQAHSFLRASGAAHGPASGRGGSLSADAIDTLAVLRASQALSSETSLTRLKARVVELLGKLTGATAVQFVLWSEDEKDWVLSVAQDDAPVRIEDAGRRGLLPLSAFRYAERTREALLVEDATRDDRFARDPYVASLRFCSLLIVPILNQGVLRAVLLLENQLSRGAFLADRLEAVMLIAGQLAVSLGNALLYERLELRVRERTQELREAQAGLVTAARQAGMAEIATNVLHNVGNILNSVNVSAEVVNSALRNSEARSLSLAVQLMEEHADDLGTFLTVDEKGKMLPGFLSALAQALAEEQQAMGNELERLTGSVDHIKQVVATQQSYAGRSSMVEPIQINDLVEHALRLNGDSLTRHQVIVVKEFAQVPLVPLDRARVLQILVNLISNARNALQSVAGRPRRLTVQTDVDGSRLRVRVLDEGEGISPKNLTRIFSHGFTTSKDGHGFGLHICALAAREMGGTLCAYSEGPNRGALFTLYLPTDPAHAEP